MKISLHILMLITVLYSSCAYAQEYTNTYNSMTTLDGQLYNRVTLKRREGNRVLIYHDKGITRIPLDILPDLVRVDIGLPTYEEQERIIIERREQEAKRAAAAKQLEESRRAAFIERERIEREEQAKKRLEDIEAARKRYLKAELLLTSIQLHKGNTVIYAEGLVGNLTDRPLSNIEAVAIFYTKDMEFVTSDSSFIKYSPLLPNQVSPYKVYASYNPRIEYVSISFKYHLGKSISVINQEEFNLLVDSVRKQ